jgi:hypothetical protein
MSIALCGKPPGNYIRLPKPTPTDVQVSLRDLIMISLKAQSSTRHEEVRWYVWLILKKQLQKKGGYIMENLDLVASCGLFCKSCSVYIASQSDENALEIIAKKLNTTKEEMYCNGCRSDRTSLHCRNCEFRNCVHEKGINNCEDCDSFPCETLREFQTKMPHRIELFESSQYRKNCGLTKWLEKMEDDYACQRCKTINSPYYIKCKQCGNLPGNRFIARNLEAIKKHLKID